MTVQNILNDPLVWSKPLRLGIPVEFFSALLTGVNITQMSDLVKPDTTIGCISLGQTLIERVRRMSSKSGVCPYLKDEFVGFDKLICFPFPAWSVLKNSAKMPCAETLTANENGSRYFVIPCAAAFEIDFFSGLPLWGGEQKKAE